MADGSPLYLLAAGGHGSVVLDALLSAGKRVVGILDPGKPVGSEVFGVPVLGGDALLDVVAAGAAVLANGAGATPGSDFRRVQFERWVARGFRFVSVVHPSAVLGRNVVLGEGCQIMAGAVLQCRTVVAGNAVVNSRSTVDHDCSIDAHAFVGPGAVLCGGVVVGPRAFVGAGASILPGIRIGSDAIVGAGAVVTRDVPSRAIVVGSPAAARERRA